MKWPARVKLVCKNGPKWLAAQCRLHKCPLTGTPFDCPISRESCKDCQESDWESVSEYIEETPEDGHDA